MKKFPLLKVEQINKNTSIRDNGTITISASNTITIEHNPFNSITTGNSNRFIDVNIGNHRESDFRLLSEDWKNRAKQLMRI